MVRTTLLRKHAYSNIENFTSKNCKFSDKIKPCIYSISAQNIDYGYSLEQSNFYCSTTLFVSTKLYCSTTLFVSSKLYCSTKLFVSSKLYCSTTLFCYWSCTVVPHYSCYQSCTVVSHYSCYWSCTVVCGEDFFITKICLFKYRKFHLQKLQIFR